MKNSPRDKGNKQEETGNGECFLTSLIRLTPTTPTEFIAMAYGIMTYPYVLAAQGAYGLYNLVFGFKK